MSDIETTAIAKIDGRQPANPKLFGNYLNNPGRKAALGATAASFMDSGRLLKIVLRCVVMNPQLQACSMDSIFRSALMAAELGLEPGSALGEAYLVPYRTKVKGDRGQDEWVSMCQMIPGYRGLIALARRSGQITDIYARAVFAGDEFEVSLGTEEHIKHVPKFGPRSPDQLIYVYSVAKIAGGGFHFDVMTKEEINAIRGRSASGGKGPWSTDYVEMAKKTVIKRMCKMLPLSIELAKAAALDNAIESGDYSGIDFDCIEVSDLEPMEQQQIASAAPAAAGSDALKEKLRGNGHGGANGAPVGGNGADAAAPAQTTEPTAAPAAQAKGASDLQREFTDRVRSIGYEGNIAALVVELLGYTPPQWDARTWQLALGEPADALVTAAQKLQGPAKAAAPVDPGNDGDDSAEDGGDFSFDDGTTAAPARKPVDNMRAFK